MSRFPQISLWLINAHNEHIRRLFEATTHRVRHRCRFLPTNVRLTRLTDSWCRLSDPYLNTQSLCPSFQASLTTVRSGLFAVSDQNCQRALELFRCCSRDVRLSGRVAVALPRSRLKSTKCYFGQKDITLAPHRVFLCSDQGKYENICFCVNL